MEKFWLQFSLDRKQAGINLRMVNWKYFLKNAVLTAIHAHISFEMDLDTCRRNIKYLFCVRNSVKYVNKIQNNSNSNSEKHFDF
jgi:hypothetical protein